MTEPVLLKKVILLEIIDGIFVNPNDVKAITWDCDHWSCGHVYIERSGLKRIVVETGSLRHASIVAQDIGRKIAEAQE